MNFSKFLYCFLFTVATLFAADGDVMVKQRTAVGNLKDLKIGSYSIDGLNEGTLVLGPGSFSSKRAFISFAEAGALSFEINNGTTTNNFAFSADGFSFGGGLLLEGTVGVTTPPTGFGALWFNSAENAFYYTDDAGTELPVGGTSATAVTADAAADAAGKLWVTDGTSRKAVASDTVNSLKTSTFRILDAVDHSHGLSFVVASDLTGDNSFTITTGDQNVALDLNSSTVDQVLRITAAGTAGPGAVNLASSNAVTGALRVANGGTGTASPALVAGTNVTITGTWPNQTINSTASGGGGMMALPYTAGVLEWTNMPTSTGFLNHNGPGWAGSGVNKLDLDSFTQVRLVVNCLAAGDTGAKMRVRYGSSFSSTASSYLTIGSSEVELNVASTGILDTGWINLVAGAIATNRYLAVVGENPAGGATDPQFNVIVYFK